MAASACGELSPRQVWGRGLQWPDTSLAMVAVAEPAVASQVEEVSLLAGRAAGARMRTHFDMIGVRPPWLGRPRAGVLRAVVCACVLPRGEQVRTACAQQNTPRSRLKRRASVDNTPAVRGQSVSLRGVRTVYFSQPGHRE